MRTYKTATIICLIIMLIFTGCSHQTDNSAKTPNVNNIIGEATKNKAEVSVWDGTIATAFGGGNGSQSNPYQINNASQLAYLSNYFCQGRTSFGEYFDLNCNVNLNGKEWTPIGKYTDTLMIDEVREDSRNNYDKTRYDFQGVFNGKDHFVSNFCISKIDEERRQDIGFFGSVVDATISNLTVKNFDIRVNAIGNSVGGLIGSVKRLSTIINCHVQNGTINALIGNSEMGGLIGLINQSNKGISSVDYCSAGTSIYATCGLDKSTYWYNSDGQKEYNGGREFSVGGLIGDTSSSYVHGCCSSGRVNVTSHIVSSNNIPIYNLFVAGFIGNILDNFVSDSYSSCDVSADIADGNGACSGFIGKAGGVNDYKASIDHCFSIGKIDYKGDGFDCGGLIGTARADIRNCFTCSKLTLVGKPESCGVLIGYIKEDNFELSNNYFLNNTKNEDIKYNNNNYATGIDEKVLISKEFLGKTLGFSEYQEDMYAVAASGWILSDQSLPYIYFEDDIKTNPVKIGSAAEKYIGSSIKKLITKFGNDYMSVDNSFYYPGSDVLFK